MSNKALDLISTEMHTVVLKAIEGTSEDCSTQFNKRFGMRAKLIMPVFSLPEEGLLLEGAVAVVMRNHDGLPVHGGLYGVSADGRVVKLVLIDQPLGINTDAEPAWTAFGLLMANGPIRICERGDQEQVRMIPWSILDLGVGRMHEPVPGPNAVRLAVHEAYITQVLPTLNILH